VEHLRIFGCPIYIHIPKDKRKKLEPRERRAYLLDTVNHPKPTDSIPEQHKVEVNKDVTFNEKMAFKKSIEESIEEEYEELKEESTHLPKSQNEEPEQLDHLMQPCEPIEPVTVPKTRKRPTWLEATLQEAENSKPQVAPSEKAKNPKDSPAMQHV
jgi:hypothetical protein